MCEKMGYNSIIGGDHIRKYDFNAEKDELTRVLVAMWPENRAVLAVAYHTGLPISQIVALRPAQLQGEWLHAAKARFWLPAELRAVLRRIASKYYIFPHRIRSRGHRTRRAVYKDLRRACKAVRATREFTPGYFAALYCP